jgi:hypothetical protein
MTFTMTSMESLDSIFTRLDLVGGWPLGSMYLLRFHGSDQEIECKFAARPAWNNWWSVVCGRDDYLWWKISDEWKDRFRIRVASSTETKTIVRLPELTERLY